MQRQEVNAEPKEITTQEFARISRENNELKVSLQTSEKRASELASRCETLSSDCSHFQAEVSRKNASLEKVQDELEQTKKDLQTQQNKYIKKLNEYKASLEDASSAIETLRSQNSNLQKQVAEAKQEAEKTPCWKIILGVGFLMSGVLLIMTGAGAVAGVSMVGLGYAAFGAGAATLLGGFLYSVYKCISACCFSSSESNEVDSDSEDSENNHPSPVLGRSNQGVKTGQAKNRHSFHHDPSVEWTSSNNIDGTREAASRREYK